MKIVFLDAGTFYGSPDLQSLLSPFGELALYSATSSEEVISRIQEVEVVLTNKVRLGEEHFKNAAHLKLICVTATGTNNVDLFAAEKYGIQVRNAVNYSTMSVAQTTFALVLHLMMRLGAYNRFVQDSYSSHSFFTHLGPPFIELSGKKWGIIGLGNIGKKVAEIATSFGCKVTYHSPSGHEQEIVYPCLSLEELLRTSDIISIHSPLNPLTKDLIGEKELKWCKKEAVLVNVARGGIVDELALANALDKDILGGAGVDVFSTEPILPNNPLLMVEKKDKLLLTPHIAWGSQEARGRLMEIVCEAIRQYIASKH